MSRNEAAVVIILLAAIAGTLLAGVWGAVGAVALTYWVMGW